MLVIDDMDTFLKQYEKEAYKIAAKFQINGYTELETEDIQQMALIYLWEATKQYDEHRGASFGTFAHIYIHSKLSSYFQKLNSKKNAANRNRVDLTALTENGKDGYETILEAPQNADSINYKVLRLDIEMQLQKLKNTAKYKRGKTLSGGIQIIEQLMKGNSPAEIKKELKLSEEAYKKYLFCARTMLKPLVR